METTRRPVTGRNRKTIALDGLLVAFVLLALVALALGAAGIL